tara:strand:+ start:23871 stop:24203 length:333 start_codon:yes stop_codon:yes gene_type:complete
MAFTNFKRRDGQRFRKVYPRTRKTPRYFTISDETMIVESNKIAMTNGTSGTFTFQVPYIQIPTVQLSAETSSDSQGMINVFITSLSLTAVTFETSAPFTGTIHIQIIKIG